jgi:hypothetical protein
MTKNGHRELLSYDKIARYCVDSIPSIDVGNISADKIPQKLGKAVKNLLPNLVAIIRLPNAAAYRLPPAPEHE